MIVLRMGPSGWLAWKHAELLERVLPVWPKREDGMLQFSCMLVGVRVWL